MFSDENHMASLSPRCLDFDDCKYLPLIAKQLKIFDDFETRELCDAILSGIKSLQQSKTKVVARKRLTELQGVNDIIIKENTMLNDEVIRQRCYIKSMEGQLVEMQRIVQSVKKY